MLLFAVPSNTPKSLCLAVLIAVAMAPRAGAAVDIPGSVHEAGTGAPLAGFVVTFSGASDDQQAVVGPDGSFLLRDAPAADTPLLVQSETGAPFGTFSAAGGRATIQVEPSGHVFASDTGAPVAGVIVRLLRTGAVVAQLRTGRHGLYRFELTGAGTYTLDVVVDAERYHFPSLLLPPLEGSAEFDPATGLVSAPAAPAPRAPRAYWLSFLAEADTAVAPRHNHIAVDRGGAVVVLSKTASKHQAAVGDIITYTLRVENRSKTSYARDGDRGGVVLRDILPAQLRMIAGSPRASVDGVRVNVAPVRDPQLLEFKLADFEDGTPFELNAGSRIFLRYQVAVGVNARRNDVATTRATVMGTDGVAISDEARVSVTVVGDPTFDSSWVTGRVYCDEDGDGWAGAADPGIYGARVYIDTGRYAVTDRDGKYHFSDVPPGLHLIKVDTNTVPTGSEEVVRSSRSIHFSRGIPVQTSFGFRCTTGAVGPTEVHPAGQDAVVAVPDRVIVAGKVETLSVQVGGKRVGAAGAATLVLNGAPDDGKLLDVPWSPTPLMTKIGFGLGAPEGLIVGVWRLWVEAQGADGKWHPVRGWGATGAPPPSVVWDGTDGTGQQVVVRRGARHRARFEVSDGSSRWRAVPVSFTVGYQRSGPLRREAINGDPIARRKRLSRSVKKLISRVGRSVRKMAAVELLVRVGAGETADAEAMEKALRVAHRIASSLAGRAKITVGQVGVRAAREAPGVMIEVFDASVQKQRPPLQADKPSPPGVFVDGAAVAIGADGAFLAAPRRPADGVVVVEISNESGASREALVAVGEAQKPNTQRVEAALSDGQLTIAGKSLNLGLMALSVGLPWPRLGLIEGQPEVPIAFEISAPEAGVTSWKLAMTGPDGAEVFSKEGEGGPPESVEFQSAGPLVEGSYSFTISVASDKGERAWSPPGTLTLQAETTGGAVGTLLRTFRGKLFSKMAMHKTLRGSLKRLVSTLAARPAGERWIVEVHGSGEDDAVTARLRTTTQANRVRNFLVLKGVPDARIEAVGMENQRPLATPDTRRGRKRNLRVEVRIIPSKTARAPTKAWGLEVDGRVVRVSGQGKGLSRLAPRTETNKTVRITVNGRYGERLEAEFEPPPPAEAKDAEGQKQPFGIPALSRAIDFRKTGKGAPPALAVSDLVVHLPPDDAELGQPLLPIKGTVPADAGISVSINGKPVPVEDGAFELLLPMANGERSAVEIEARDKEGNVARIKRTYHVKGNALFLMALGDGAMSQDGTQLVQSTSTWDVGPVLLHGRAALYLKARIKGGKLIKNIKITAYADSARDTEVSNFVDQIIDAERYYPIYGDAAEEGTDARTRGKYYVAVEAGRNRLIVGTFKAGEWGIDLLRYDRVMEGAKVRLDQTWTKGYDTVVEGFASYADERVRRSHATLSGTGGSYYFLPDKEIVEGSEQVSIAIFDRDSGARLQTVGQARDADYSIDYRAGRLTFKKPVPSQVDASFLVGASDAIGGRLGFQGHEVRIQVDYETRAVQGINDLTWGANGSQSFAGIVKVGGGYVREGRAAGAGPDYELMGAQLAITPGKTTRIEAEVARSRAGNGANWLSRDGGLTYNAVGAAPQQTQKGWGITVRGRTDIGEFLGRTEPFLQLAVDYQSEDEGFVSSHTVLEQGHVRGGGSLKWHINREQQLVLRHDTLSVVRGALGAIADTGTNNRNLTSAQYSHRLGRLTLVGDVLQAREEIGDADPINRSAFAVLARYKISPRLTLWGEQQAIVGGDDTVLRSFGDRMITGIGLDIALGEHLQLTLGEQVRWSGEDASVLGLRTRLSDSTTMYVQQRLLHPRDSHRWVPATVIGSEERWGSGGQGRSYGEYQIGTAASGTFNRAVLGLGRRFELLAGLYADVAIERSHTTVVDDIGVERDMTTLSVGGDYIRHERFKMSTRFEARFETAEADRLQLVSFNRVSADLGAGVALLGRADIAITQNQELDKREAETINLQLGLAYRPLDETFTLLLKAAHQVDMRPVHLDSAGGSLRTTADVIAVEPIVELPLRLQLTPKFAWRRAVEEAEETGGAVESTTLLAALRLAFHLVETVDIAAEYRWIDIDIIDQMEHGALAEIAVNISRYVRIGVGYNFTSFNDNLFVPATAPIGSEPIDPLSRNNHGFFVRLAGMY